MEDITPLSQKQKGQSGNHNAPFEKMEKGQSGNYNVCFVHAKGPFHKAELPNSRFGQGGHVLLLRRTNPILGGHREDKRNLRRTKGGHFNFKVEKRRTASIFSIIVLV